MNTSNQSKVEAAKLQSKRIFFALALTAREKESIADWRSQHLTDLKKPVAKNNFHLTLRYIGNCQMGDITNLKQAATKITCPEFKFSLDTLGHFKKPRVLYLGVNQVPNRLLHLAKSVNAMVDDTLKFKSNSATDRFTPHVTIARKVSAAINVSDLFDNKFDIKIEARKFALFESVSTVNGVVYTELMSWPLSELYQSN
ncbi:RNA 2',3'-cyclic phosphodiesterase [Thalassotalea sp. PS06]|uniref:RNA 2',3'-cyclic phosphodiesterase n=1 Tax=Thalassotalea sp. PS06 TaxID=2594005 RepID=UPI0011624761|nr:RNA 2',3'-cyclic phosphodiesterase [Thalassotalea sp. PS06]QDP00134.1 RNA 2',3'-cyclic phosphodiesterase [Thalassotalea sp. PS06]